MNKFIFVLFSLVFSFSSFAQRTYNVVDYGAVGNKMVDDAKAIQKAIDECSAQGGGMVLLPANHTFMSGPLCLKSNVNLHLEATAVLIANPDESIYNLSAFGENRGEGMMWIYANGADNISITGKGTIHGNGIAFMGKELDDSTSLSPLLPSTLVRMCLRLLT